MNRRPFTLQDYRKRYGVSASPDPPLYSPRDVEEARRASEIAGARERQLIAEAESIAASNRNRIASTVNRKEPDATAAR